MVLISTYMCTSYLHRRMNSASDCIVWEVRRLICQGCSPSDSPIMILDGIILGEWRNPIWLYYSFLFTLVYVLIHRGSGSLGESSFFCLIHLSSNLLFMQDYNSTPSIQSFLTVLLLIVLHSLGSDTTFSPVSLYHVMSLVEGAKEIMSSF